MTVARKNIMLGTAGHVDHGKTALVKLLTGCETDRLAEEKRRGLTIELGFAPCTMNDERIVGIVDVPGHVDFIRNMVAGAHGIDVVILVVAADDGVMPQTREHLDILTLMGVRHGLIAMTKIDLVSDEMRQLAVNDIRNFLEGTFLEDAPVCGVSNITGRGYDEFFSSLNNVVDKCKPDEDTQPFRVWIERAFHVHGFGTVASGIPTSGQVKIGDKLSIIPGDELVRVRGLEVYGQKSESAQSGECVALNLANTDPKILQRGTVLCEENAFDASTMVEAELSLLQNAGRPLKDYAEVHFHIGTADIMANVALLEDKLLHPGGHTVVQLRLTKPLCIAAGERFIIRCAAGGPTGGNLTTIGGGRILGTSNIRLKRNRPWMIQSLTERKDAIDNPAAWCELMLRQSHKAWNINSLAKQSHMRIDIAKKCIEQLLQNEKIKTINDDLLVHHNTLNDCRTQIIETLEQFHKSNHTRLGMEIEEIVKTISFDNDICKFAVDSLASDKIITTGSGIIGLAGKVLSISPADRKLCDCIENILMEAGLESPAVSELAGLLKISPAHAEKMITMLCDGGAIIRLDDKISMHRQAVEKAQKTVLDLFAKHSGFTTMQYRDALGVSRKYAVPLLDYFDTLKLTVRNGNRRTPGATAKQIMNTI